MAQPGDALSIGQRELETAARLASLASRACTHKIAIVDSNLIKSVLAHFADTSRTSPEAVKVWAKELAHESVKATEIFPLIGANSNSVIQEKVETKKGPGDRVTCGLRMQLSGDGFTESEVAEGNGESLTTFADNLFVNELGHVVGVRSENTIDAQRVSFDLREEAKDGLVDWWAVLAQAAQKIGSFTFYGTVAANSTRKPCTVMSPRPMRGCALGGLAVPSARSV